MTIEEIIELVKQFSPKEDAVVKEDSRLLEDLEYDSLAITELFDEIESRFGVDFMSDTKMTEAMGTVKELYEFICQKSCMK